jgi:general secretion pathway protein N
MKSGVLVRCCVVLSIFELLPAMAADDANIDMARDNPVAAPPLTQLDQTRRRPLFSPTRRPPPLPPPAVAETRPEAPPPAPPSLVLLGVLSDADGNRAIIRPGPTEKTRILKVGDDIAGWNVTEIAFRRLVIRREARSQAFALFEGVPQPAKAKSARPVRRN